MASAVGVEVRDEFAAFLEQNLNKELLRFTTAGSVDDGKSTLIGRLLHDSKTLYEDQLASVKKSRINRANGAVDFSLLTDGLRAEREQGITIDVGYRYFATARRKFIIADTPGHEQYTRNMATGASTADLAVILVDGTKGLLPQTLRHAYISSLLGISHAVAAINKMDLVEYREADFRRLETEFVALAKRLGILNVRCIPISALEGDNVVARSDRMTWYEGPALLEYLETVPLAAPVAIDEVRFPVQYVVRPDSDFRGFAGQLASGVIRPGDVLTALPSGQKSRVESIVTFDGPREEAFPPMSVTLKLQDEIDLSRGDMLVSPDSPPRVSKHFLATMVWMHAQPLEIGKNYLIKHCARHVRGRVTAIRHRVNVSTLEPEKTDVLQINEIGTLEIEASSPLFFDAYQENRTTGSFIVIDPLTNATLAAGMIREDLLAGSVALTDHETPKARTAIAPVERHRRHGHSPAIISLNTRTALTHRIERALFENGFEVAVVAQQDNRASAQAALTALYLAGFVVLFQGESLSRVERAGLQATAGAHFFDLAERNFLTVDAEAVQQVLALAESLRLSAGTRNSGKVV
jgi:sulfate adenylyltransferase large subunit